MHNFCILNTKHISFFLSSIAFNTLQSWDLKAQKNIDQQELINSHSFYVFFLLPTFDSILGTNDSNNNIFSYKIASFQPLCHHQIHVKQFFIPLSIYRNGSSKSLVPLQSKKVASCLQCLRLKNLKNFIELKSAP